MFNSNFDAVQRIDGEGLSLTGTSIELENAMLITRRLLLQQDGHVVEGAADSGTPRWAAVPALPADGFTAGEALAVGTEMYFVTSPTPGYASFTWTQSVKLETA
jgi:hypothetical protein